MLLWYVAMYLYVSRAGFYNGKPWKIIKVEKAAGGEMICFLSHQAFSSEPSSITERASMEPVLGSVHAG